MKIAVCIKQVVTREWQLRVNDTKTWIRDSDASFELNEPDAMRPLSENLWARLLYSILIAMLLSLLQSVLSLK